MTDYIVPKFEVNKVKKTKIKILTDNKNKCKHPNLQVLEVKFGQHVGAEAKFDNSICIWETSLMSSHRCRVVKYWCPICDDILLAPKAKVVNKRKD